MARRAATVRLHDHAGGVGRGEPSAALRRPAVRRARRPVGGTPHVPGHRAPVPHRARRAGRTAVPQAGPVGGRRYATGALAAGDAGRAAGRHAVTRAAAGPGHDHRLRHRLRQPARRGTGAAGTAAADRAPVAGRAPTAGQHRGLRGVPAGRARRRYLAAVRAGGDGTRRRHPGAADHQPVGGAARRRAAGLLADPRRRGAADPGRPGGGPGQRRVPGMGSAVGQPVLVSRYL